MTPQASLVSEFRTAWEMGKSKQAEELAINPVLDVVKSFAEDKRISHFDEDLPAAVDLLTGTLNDANRLKEAEIELDLIITHFSRMKTHLHEKADLFIKDRYDAGVLEEGDFRIVPVEKKTNRKVNREVLLSEKFKKKYEGLLESAIEDLEESFTPTVKVVEATFGKKADEILIPGMVTVVGYELKPISPMPEQASAAVEL